MSLSRNDDVLILGGGVIGLSCALALLRAGASVRVLERGVPGGGASHGNCGTLTPSHAPPLSAPGMPWRALRQMLDPEAPLYVNPRPDVARLRWLLGFARHCNRADQQHAGAARAAILLRSRQLIEALVSEEALDCEFAADGTLVVYRDAGAFASESGPHCRMLEQLGIPVELLEARQAMALEPALRPGVAGAIRHAGDARLRPDRYVAELARRVQELGGVIEEAVEITGLSGSDGQVRRVASTRGDFSGGKIVLALGAWSPLLARDLDIKLPMQPGKGYSLSYSRPSVCPRQPLVLHEASVCVTAWESGFRLGSTMEFSGYDTRLNRKRLDAIRHGAARYLRQPEGDELRETWWGWRPMSVDEVPIIGASAHWRNLLLATGHGMLGMSMSAATGELIAQLASGNPTTLDPAPFSPARFGI